MHPHAGGPQVAAAIEAHVGEGIGAVKRSLDSTGAGVDYGQIKVRQGTQYGLERAPHPGYALACPQE